MVMCISLLALGGFGGPQIETLDVDGVKREAEVFAPAKKSKHPPIVFAWHPHGGNMNEAANLFKIQQYWPEAVVVYPQGLKTKSPVDPQGKHFGWQRVEGDYNDRDLKFFDKLYAKLDQQFSFDHKRTYSMGFSNGAFFTYLLWHARYDKLAAAEMAAASIDDPNKPLKPLPVFVIAGTQDHTVQFVDQRKAISYDRSTDGVPQNATPVVQNGIRHFHGSKDDVNVFVHPGGHIYPPAMSPFVVQFFKNHHQ